MKNTRMYFLDESSICRHFELTKTEFKQALTHNSAPNKNNGSRYVFLGQYGFRGILSKWIFENIGGTGMELQHYMGNIFSQSSLEKLYDEWGLKRFIIYGEKCQPEKQKHIFVYSLIGCLMQHTSPEKLEKFMLDFFIYPNDHILPKTHFPRDDWQKLIFLCKQNGYDKPVLQYILTEENKHQFSLVLSDGKTTKCKSVSYRYAKKKTIKKTFEYITLILEEKLLNDPNYIQLEDAINKQKEDVIEQQNEELLQKWQLKQTEKQQQKINKTKEKKDQANERDRKRRKIKEEVKLKKQSRKGKDTIYREYTTNEIAAINPAKRRRLEDLGILSKSK